MERIVLGRCHRRGRYILEDERSVYHGHRFHGSAGGAEFRLGRIVGVVTKRFTVPRLDPDRGAGHRIEVVLFNDGPGNDTFVGVTGKWFQSEVLQILLVGGGYLDRLALGNITELSHGDVIADGTGHYPGKLVHAVVITDPAGKSDLTAQFHGGAVDRLRGESIQYLAENPADVFSGSFEFDFLGQLIRTGSGRDSYFDAPVKRIVSQVGRRSGKQPVGSHGRKREGKYAGVDIVGSGKGFQTDLGLYFNIIQTQLGDRIHHPALQRPELRVRRGGLTATVIIIAASSAGGRRCELNGADINRLQALGNDIRDGRLELVGDIILPGNGQVVCGQGRDGQLEHTGFGHTHRSGRGRICLAGGGVLEISLYQRSIERSPVLIQDLALDHTPGRVTITPEAPRLGG